MAGLCMSGGWLLAIKKTSRSYARNDTDMLPTGKGLVLAMLALKGCAWLWSRAARALAFRCACRCVCGVGSEVRRYWKRRPCRGRLSKVHHFFL